MNDKIKKKYTKIIVSLLGISLALALFMPKKIKLDITKNEKLLKESNYYGTTSAGDIYIGDIVEINRLMRRNVQGIFIVDERETDDPNMVILSSYEITEKKQMLEILTLLQMYEETFPTEWDRTTDSMMNEWTVHNILYDFNYKQDHTTDVDLNNDDENKYDNFVLTYVLGNNIDKKNK